MSETAVNFYELLGVSPSADDREIRAAFRRRAHELHPDKGGEADEFVKLRQAFEVLTNPYLRGRYDLALEDGTQVLAGQTPEGNAAARVDRLTVVEILLERWYSVVCCLAFAAAGVGFFLFGDRSGKNHNGWLVGLGLVFYVLAVDEFRSILRALQEGRFASDPPARGPSRRTQEATGWRRRRR